LLRLYLRQTARSLVLIMYAIKIRVCYLIVTAIRVRMLSYYRENA